MMENLSQFQIPVEHKKRPQSNTNDSVMAQSGRNYFFFNQIFKTGGLYQSFKYFRGLFCV